MEWKDRIQVNPRLIRLKNKSTNEVIDYEIQDLEEEEIIQEGTQINASSMNRIEDEISELDGKSQTIEETLHNLQKKVNGTTYKMSAGIGWKRIAQLSGMCSTTVHITNTTSYGTSAILNITDLSGWDGSINKVAFSYTNDKYFTKARLVSKGGALSYLELYQAVADRRDITIKSSGLGLSIWDNDSAGGVPSGYTSKEVTL